MFQIMFFAGLVLTFIFLILSIVLFIKNNVAKLIGDVTGWNAKRAIKKINEKGTGEKSKTQSIKSEVSKVLVHNSTSAITQKPLEVGAEQSIMEAIHEAQGTSPASLNAVFRTEENMVALAGEEMDEVTSILAAGEETTLLSEEDEITSILAGEETTLLSEGEEPTSVLAGEETTLLSEGEEPTSVLTGEETSVLGEGEEPTSVLTGEETSVLGEGEETTGILEEETVVVADKFTSILNQAVVYDTSTVSSEDVIVTDIPVGEKVPMPDIFEVEEDTMIVHTKDKIEIDLDEVKD